jgi:hypothetical protein
MRQRLVEQMVWHGFAPLSPFLFIIVTDEIYFHFVVSNPKLCILDGIVLFVLVPQPPLTNFEPKTDAFTCRNFLKKQNKNTICIIYTDISVMYVKSQDFILPLLSFVISKPV